MSEETLTKYRLWHCREEDDKICVDEIEDRPLKRDMLSTNETYILELYDKIYIWQGRNASAKEKHASFNIAVEHKKKWEKPAGTSVSRIPEGCEDSLFRSYFEGFWGVSQKFETEKENMNTIANKHIQARDNLNAQLGELLGIEVYCFNEECTDWVQIQDPEFGHFFSEEVYCINIRGSQHTFSVNW